MKGRALFQQDWRELEAARRRFQRMLLIRDLTVGGAAIVFAVAVAWAVMVVVR